MKRGVAVLANLYVLGSRQKNAVPRQPRENQPTSALTKDDWFVNPEQVYLTLGEAKSQGDARYKTGRLVRINDCPALVFITDEHYFPVLDLNTPKPFAGLHQLVVEEGVYLDALEFVIESTVDKPWTLWAYDEKSFKYPVGWYALTTNKSGYQLAHYYNI